MIGKLLCRLGWHELTLLSYGDNSTANARCNRCKKHKTVSLWGIRP